MKELRWRAAVATVAALAAAMPTGMTAEAAPRSSLSGGMTLITGDVVHVLSGDKVSVSPGAGRKRVTFLTQHSEGHTYVVPGDAVPLMNAGRLDRRLFDVTLLAESGYGDPKAKSIPLIAKAKKSSSRSQVRTWAKSQGVSVAGDIAALDVTFLRPARKNAVSWWKALTRGSGLAGGIDSVWLDGKRQLTLDRSTAQIGAPKAWKAGFTGKGVKVAVLDSGIDASHKDFAGRIVDSRTFLGGTDTTDTVGHGTHVASILAGSGAASDDRYRGVAPEASLLVGKVCGDNGCPESAILAGMQWATSQGADVVNLSLGGDDTPEVDLLEEAVNRLSAEHETLFVVAAGNTGDFGVPYVLSPSTAEAALSVAMSTRHDNISIWSAWGPRFGDGGSKPEIAAPGVDIVAARSSAAEYLDPVDEAGAYTAMRGTSMATPHVAGAAVLLSQQHPGWSGSRLKAALMGTAASFPDVDATLQGAGRVDLARAVSQSLTADTGSLNYGVQAWPHTDDKPVVREVTYHNEGAEPVTVDLRAGLSGPDGAAPASMVTVAPRRITVPAGGSASGKVSVDTSVDAPVGRYAGTLTASVDGGVVANTLLSVVREAEHHTVKLKALDRHGAPAAGENVYVHVASWSSSSSRHLPVPDGGEMKLRLPKGNYTIGGAVVTDAGSERESWSMLSQPRLSLSKDISVVLDARRARPVKVTVPDSTATPVSAAAGYRLADVNNPDAGVVLGITNADRGFDNLYTGQVGSSARGERYRSYVLGRWARRGADGSFLNSPYTYNAGLTRNGGMATGVREDLQTEDFATVRTSFHGQAGNQGLDFAGLDGFTVSSEVITDLPGEQVGYYHSTGEVGWSRELTEIRLDGRTVSRLMSEHTVYRENRSYEEEWGTGVLSHGLNSTAYDTGGYPHRSPQAVSRTRGDMLWVYMGLVDPAPGRVSTPHHLFDSAAVRLFRGDRLLAENTRSQGRLMADLPREEATYRLESEIDRTSSSSVSTKISAAWTFRSSHSSKDRPEKLMAVHFAPALDDGYRAPAGAKYRIPIWIEHQDLTDPAKVTTLTVEVSYDDGATWKRADLSGSRDKWTATVHHPDGEGHVSLRATATDAEGGKVKQTILRAYLLR